MDERWYLLTALGAVVLAAGAVAWDRLRLRRTMARLERMLDEAMAGDFTGETFDESRLSALESQMRQYLSASAVSARAVRTEKDKIKALIADISHQTRTPIANLLLYTQLLSEQDLTPEGRACLAALEGQAEKLRSLIDALVKTSRLETGILALHPEPGRLGSTVAAAAAQLAPAAAARGIALTVEPGDVTAVFDAKWTEEALCNLLDNAVKYTPAGGAVRIRLTAYPLFARVDVEDTGPGIPEEEQTRIFQRFYRSPANHDAPGVGVGLYLVRQIAAGQGGYVRVFSPKSGGAKFSLYLPRER